MKFARKWNAQREDWVTIDKGKRKPKRAIGPGELTLDDDEDGIDIHVGELDGAGAEKGQWEKLSAVVDTGAQLHAQPEHCLE